MPKIELSAAKGLVQKTGHGFIDADFQTIDASLNLESSGTSSQKSALLNIIQGAGAALTVTLHDTGATAGQVKIFVLETKGGGTVKIADTTGDIATLGAAGDLAICVYNGTNWKTGNSLT